MNNTDFDKIVQDTITSITTVLTSKAKEYADDTDRLHNFKVAARMGNVTPEIALKMFKLKHEVSVDDMICNTVNNIPTPISKELIDEKIGDIINYNILLKALLYERYNLK
jgi:hypothetical protein